MTKPEDLIKRIEQTFATASYPGDDRLRGSDMGDEPYLLEQEFRGRDDWRALPAQFLDLAPDGFASALSFFSDEAFRFYLPAYLVADLKGVLRHADPVFALTYGLYGPDRYAVINPRWHGDLTWWQAKRQRFDAFTPAQAQVILDYLHHILAAGGRTDFERSQIVEAIDSYWRGRAGVQN